MQNAVRRELRAFFVVTRIACQSPLSRPYHPAVRDLTASVSATYTRAPRHEFSPGDTAMSKRSLPIFLIVAFVLATLSLAQEPSRIRQPRLTPQDSGTSQGLIAVSPVNPRVVWASGRGGTFVVTTAGETGEPAWSPQESEKSVPLPQSKRFSAGASSSAN